MKKYLRLTCSLCKRSTDRPVDSTHFAPDKCTITFKCEGRLFPVEYRSDAGTITKPQVGITDWHPRGSFVNGSVAAKETEFINTSTGSLKQLVIAATRQTAGRPAVASFETEDTLTLTLAVRNDAPKAYRQYVFRSEGTIASVNGVESGLDKKVLRFSQTDTIEVLLNGVKMEQGSGEDQFSIYTDESSAVPPNTIRFNSPVSLPGVTQVDVIVSTAAATTRVTLKLKRNISDESRLTLGAWENVDQVVRVNDAEYDLYTIDLEDAENLKLNTIMTVESISTPFAMDKAFILLANAPYTQLDRYRTVAIPLSTLSFDRDYLKYFVVNGQSVLYATKTSAMPLYPPFQARKFNVEQTIQKAQGGVTDQLVIDNTVIVGPDV